MKDTFENRQAPIDAGATATRKECATWLIQWRNSGAEKVRHHGSHGTILEGGASGAPPFSSSGASVAQATGANRGQKNNIGRDWHGCKRPRGKR
jgi:hypothetical protein